MLQMKILKFLSLTRQYVKNIYIYIKRVDNKISIAEQKLKHFERIGFTAVEWGEMIY